LSTADQDAVLTAMERNTASGFATGAAAFFNLVLGHTIQGTFCDPFYGGNDRFVGWDLIGYPGVRLIATANDQRIDAPPAATHMSAYDYTMFSKKKPARASRSDDAGPGLSASAEATADRRSSKSEGRSDRPQGPHHAG
jgi:hypothetical protein